MAPTRSIQFLLTVALLSTGNMAAVVSATPARHPMRKEYVKKTFGVRAIPPVVAGAALNRRKGSFGHHLVTSAEGHVAKNTVQYGVAAIRHEDLHYHRSTQRGFAPRLRHALVSTVITHKTTTGKKTVASGKLSGAAAAGLVAGGAATAGLSVGADAGANVAREFWPRRRKTSRN